MSDFRKLVKHSSHYFGGKLGVMLLGFVSFPLFTRLLSVEEYGFMALITQVVLLCTTVAKLGFQHSMQRFHREKVGGDEQERQSYYSTTLFATVFVAVGVVCVFLAAILLLPLHIDPRLHAGLLVASGLIFIRALRSMVNNLLQIESKTVAFNVIEIASKAGTVIGAVWLLFRWEHSVRAFFIATTAVETIALGTMFYYLLRGSLIRVRAVSGKFLVTMITFGVPMMWSELAQVLLDSGDRVLIQYFVGATALGYYAAAYGVAYYLNDLLIGSLNLAFVPICMEILEADGEESLKRFIARSLKNYILVSCGIVAITVATSRDMLVILASRKYEHAHAIIPVVVIGMILASFHLFFRIGLFVRKKTVSLASLTTASMVLNLLLNVVLLPWIGVMGAAIATLLSFAIWIAATAWVSIKAFPVPFEFAAYARYAFVAGLAAAAGLLVHISHHWVEAAVRGCIVVCLYLGVLYLSDAHSRSIFGRSVHEVKRFAATVG